METDSKCTALPSPATLSYEDGKSMMAQGSEALHQHLSQTAEAALGTMLPQVEVRFKNLSVTAQINVSSSSNNNRKKTSHELPTLVNEVKKSLRVLTASTKSVRKEMLKNVNGVFKPGTMTLVLGQPGSGKSTLMKVLSGRFPRAKNVAIDGEITFNGELMETLRHRLPQLVSYVTQRDHHFATLTVKETLQFAHDCCGTDMTESAVTSFTQGTSEQNKAALDTMRAMVAHYPDVVIQQLGLENCQDTVVGDAMLRGVSGGERKRVTTGEMQFGSMYVSLMDEISTGLDSAAAFDIIKTQRSVAKHLRKTVVIALLQPSPEIFALFDDVMILNDGHVMYHGPCDQVMNYFTGLGFRCPANRDVADYLMDLGTRQQHKYAVLPANGGPESHPRRAAEFAELFERSEIHANMLTHLHGPVDPVHVVDTQSKLTHVRAFHQSFWASTATLVARELLMMSRNTALIKGRGVMLIVMGLLYSSIFWQFDAKDVQVVMGVLFSASLFLALGQGSQIPMFMASREVFYKQRGANFFRTSSYVLASSLSQIPLAIFESLVFGSMIYWMCGFVATGWNFFLFEVILILTNLAFTAWFFFLTAMAPDLHVAEPISMVTVIFFVLFAGFVISKDQIPVYFIWIYWINPVSWSIRALAINQYRNAVFDRCEYDGVQYCDEYGMEAGVYSLSLFDVESDKVWLWYGLAYLVVAYLFFMSLSFYMLEFHRYEGSEYVGVGVGNGEGKHEENPLATTVSGGSGSEASRSNSNNNSDGQEDNEFALMETPRKGQDDDNDYHPLAIPVADDKEGEAVTHDRHFVPVALAFQDLWYSVPHPSNPKTESLDLLKGVSGFALPGTMTALMGSSGAGKTTLMDVIAGRKSGGTIRGQILLNGHAASDLAIRRATGYCEQMDIHSEASTIREALTFSAFLRQGRDVPDRFKMDSVDECLDLLDLHPIADQIIRGSSVEQMKRLTIGVELAAQPSVLFLDEPTSGLDARSAKVIMDGVRKVANTGRTVVCTIHQPSTEVFLMFDSLLLLKRGGETVYVGDLGPRGSEMVAYFEAIPGVPHVDTGYNPGAWMLEVIGAGVGNGGTTGQETDFVAHFNASEKKALLDKRMNQEGVTFPTPGSEPLAFANKRAASEWTQARFVIQRFLDLYWRTPSYNLTRFMISILMAIVFGLSFLTADYATYQGINAGEGMVFLTTMFLGVISFNSILPISSQERASFYRERAAQTYNALWYFIGGTIVEIPYVFGSTLLFTSIFFPMVGFTGLDRFLLYWLGVSTHVLLQMYIGQFLAYALPTVEVAMIIGVIVISVSLQFMGFNPPADAIPSGYKWLYYITPPKYTYSILSAVVFGDCPDDHAVDSTELACQRLQQVPPTVPKNLTVKEYVELNFLAKHEDLAMNFFIVLAAILVFRLLALLSLRFINHQKK